MVVSYSMLRMLLKEYLLSLDNKIPVHINVFVLGKFNHNHDFVSSTPVWYSPFYILTCT